MRLIDTHTHLYQPKFDSDRDEAVERCFAEGVDTLLLPNIDLESVPRVLGMMEKWPDSCFGMMGLHPCHIGEGWEVELEEIRRVLDSPPEGKKFVAVGEIGLDLYWERKHIEAQREAFRIQVGWAKERELPIVIHVRNAWEELFEEIDKLKEDLKELDNLKLFSNQVQEIIKYNNATEYISGPAARDYVEPHLFEDKAIKLTWFDYSGYKEYPQLWGEFTHGVTILDLLFNCGKEAHQYMRYVPS